MKVQQSRNYSALDGGWAWFVLAASFITHFLMAALYFAYGVFTQAWMQEFNSSAALTSMIGSTSSAFTSMSAPLGSFLQHKWGCRKCHLIGGVLVSSGVFLSSRASSLVQLFMFYGVMGGVGLGLCYVPAIICLSEYFKVRRPVAIGIASTGVGVGSFVFPLVIEFMQDQYGWRGSVMVLSGIMANTLLAATIMFPLTHFRSRNLDINSNKAKKLLRSGVGVNVKPESHVVHDDATLGADEGESGVNPRAAQAQRGSGISLVRSLARHPWMRRKSSMALFKDSPRATGGQQSAKRENTPLKLVIEASEEELNSNKNIESTHNDDDVLSASHATLSGENETFRSQLRSILVQPLFYLMVLNNLTMFIGMMIVFGLTPIRAIVDLGFSSDDGAVFVSAIGLANLVGRFSWGAINNMFPSIDPIVFFIGLRVVASVLTLLSPLATSFTMQMCYCAAVGLVFGAWSLYPLVVAKMFGDRYLNAAFGFLEFFNGVGSLVGPTLGGLIYDITNTYQMSFIMAGVTLGGGTLVLAIGCYVFRDRIKS